LKDASLIEDIRQFDSDASISDIEKDDFTVVIPVLNEKEGIGSVIEGVKREGYRNILVVDGYSTDETVSIASSNGAGVIFQHGIGKTGAIKTVIEHVKTPYFIVMDGDCTYDPRDIQNFFPHILKNYEVIGVRTIGRENIPFLNRFGNLVINSTFNLLFGTSLVDVCSGMYALRTDFAKQLSLETGGFDVEVEVAAQAANEGRITQVPISYNTRVGQQKLRPWRDGLQILFTVWKLAISYNPVFLFSAVAALAMIPALIILFWVAVEWLQGVWHNGLALFGVMLIIIALFALTVSTISMLLKRMEQRITRKLKLM
jgi:dolichol-phosphate mannosyltransferase